MKRCEVCLALEKQVEHLQGLLAWYRDENRSLLNRLLISSKLPAIMQDEDKPVEEEPVPVETGENYGNL